MVWSQPKIVHIAALSLLPLSGMGRRIRRKRKNLVEWDKNISTETQREKKIATRILIKIIYRVQFSHGLMLSLPPSSKSPCSSQLHHVNTK